MHVRLILTRQIKGFNALSSGLKEWEKGKEKVCMGPIETETRAELVWSFHFYSSNKTVLQLIYFMKDPRYRTAIHNININTTGCPCMCFSNVLYTNKTINSTPPQLLKNVVFMSLKKKRIIGINLSEKLPLRQYLHSSVRTPWEGVRERRVERELSLKEKC